MSESKDYISLHDSKLGFWRRYFVTYGTLLACIGVGVLVQSDALQWIGSIIWFLGILGWAITYAKQGYKTPQEAADYLAEKYGAVASKRGTP